MKVIGFTAKVGGGKDTAGKLITEALTEKGYTVTKLSFAKPLKDICTMMFGWDRERLEHDFDYKEGNTLDDGSPDPACELLGKTRRVVMQELGTEAMRNGLHSDVWIIAMRLAILRGEYDQYDYGLLTDCRFLNELQFVRDLDGTLIQLKRFGEQSTLTDQTQHASELEWETWTGGWDAEVVNYIDPDLTEEENLLALRNKLEDAIGYQDIPDMYSDIASPDFRRCISGLVSDELAAEEVQRRLDVTRHFKRTYGDNPPKYPAHVIAEQDAGFERMEQKFRSAHSGDPIAQEIDDPHWDGEDDEAGSG